MMNRRHGHHDNGKPSPTYVTWQHMKARCDDPKHHAYARYGGRGVRYVKRWSKFENFLADMGVRPEGLTLDRINNEELYSKANCRWATRKEQARNRKIPEGPKLSTADKVDIQLRLLSGCTPAELAAEYGVTRARISQVKLGR